MPSEPRDRLQEALRERYTLERELGRAAYVALGRYAEAEQILRELLDRRRRAYVVPTSLGVLSAGLGDTVETFGWLGRAVEGRDPFLLYNYVNDSIMAPFRRDPRGQAILRAMGLAPAL